MSRILMVMRPDRGGVFTHVRRLGGALVEQGHEVAVAGPLAHRAGHLPGMTVLPVAIPRDIQPIAQAKALRSVAGAIRHFRPDLIHAHGSQGGVLARLARPVSPRIPLVFTPHLYAFDNHFANQRYRALYKAIERGLAPLATRVLCVCEFEAKLARSVGPDGRVRVVYNGTPPIDVTARPAGEDSAGLTIGTVAELRRSKGVPLLVEAFAGLLTDFPDLNLVIAGDGPERHEVEDAIANHGVGDRVRLLGRTDGPASLLGEIDLFVNPALAEAFPYTIIEAMSAGLPVVATDVGGSAEAVIDGRNGLVVEPGNPQALRQAIASLLAKPAQLSAMGEASRHLYNQNFTLEQMLTGTQAVYAEILPR